MKKKSLIISVCLILLAAGGGAAGAWWWWMNQPAQLAARAQLYMESRRGKDAVELLTRLGRLGNMDAVRQIAILYAEGRLVPQDEALAARYYLQLAEHGDADAQREMAARCIQGRGVPQSAADAARWLAPFAEQGDVDSLHKICFYYMSGALSGDSEAVKWYRAAAETMPAAKRALADCYASGKGVEKNPSEAARLYEQIITDDDGPGLYHLAQCYAAAGDRAKSEACIEQAVALGELSAIAQMGCKHYDAGNYAMALPLLQLAAEAGDSASAARMAICCEYGLGRSQDVGAAVEWTEIAKNGGVDMNAVPRPVQTPSQGDFNSSVPFAQLPNTTDLFCKISSHPQEEDDYVQTITLSNENITKTPIQYRRTLDVFRGECLIVNEDIVATVKDEDTIDFWDSRSLRYFLSGRGMRSYNSDELYQYDASTGRLAYRSLELGDYSAVYMGGMNCTAIDFMTLQTELNRYDFDDLYGTRLRDRIVQRKAGKVFSYKKFQYLNALQDNVLMPETGRLLKVNRDTLLLQRLPALRDLAAGFCSLQQPLRVTDIDYEKLTVKHRNPAAATQSENQRPPAIDFRDVKGLDISREWRISGVKGSYYHIDSNDDGNKQTSYIYDSAKRILYPVFSQSGFHGELEGAASDVHVGSSDMGWYTTTIRSWVMRYMPEWMGELVWDSKNNRVYQLVGEDENGETHELESQDYSDFKIAGHFKIQHFGGSNLLSIWNQLPGNSNRAYWISAGDAGWCINIMNPARCETQLLAHGAATWSKGQRPVWLNERQWLCVPLNEHVWRVYHFDIQTESVNEVCCLYFHQDNEFAIALPDGRYAGSPGCESFLFVQKDGRNLDMSALAAWRNRPAEVLEALGGNAEEVETLRYTTNRWLRKMGFNPKAMPAEPSAADFPVVEVVRPALRSSQQEVTVPIKVRASGTAVNRVEIRLDGVEIPQTWSSDLYVAPGSETVLQAKLSLVNGQNWVEIMPVDTAGLRGNTERFRILCETITPQPCTYVVALGISDYDDSSLNLQYAAKDAGDIAEAFKRYYQGRSEVLLLRNGEVRASSVLDKVRDFVSNASPQDSVVMYCAGHGMLDDKLEYYFAPSDFDSEHIASTGIPMEALLNTLEATPARNRLLMLDTCHAGELGEEDEEKMALAMGNLPPGVRAIHHRGMKVKNASSSLNAKQKKRYVEELFSSGTSRRGVNVLAGAAGAEFALESGEWKNGVFTASVIEALSGAIASDTNNDGMVDVSELYHAVSNAVRTRTGGAQSPTMSLLENRGEQTLVHNLGAFVLRGDWSAVEKMASQGYKLREADRETGIPWLAVAFKKKAPLRTIEALLNAGVSVNSWVDEGYKKMSLLEYVLLDLRSNNMDSQYSYTPEEAYQIILMMLKRGATLGVNELLHDWRLMKAGSAGLVEQLLKHGGDVNSRDETGNTPLMCTSDPSIACLLIRYGADISAVNFEGKTVFDLRPDFRQHIEQVAGLDSLNSARSATERLVVARLNHLVEYDVFYEEAQLRKSMAEIFEPVVTILPDDARNHDQLVADLKNLSARWPSRVYKVLAVARKGNEIEIQVHYKCKGPEVVGVAPRQVEGYALMSMQLNSEGKIKCLGERTSKKSPPAFGCEMKLVDYSGPVVFQR